MMQGDEAMEFYKRHRGGSGAVVVVIAINGNNGKERTGIFGSLDTAHEWRRSMPDYYTFVYAPYIVDDPDWGNEADRLAGIK